MHLNSADLWPRGLMDKASDFGSEDCEFESRRGRRLFLKIMKPKSSFAVQPHSIGHIRQV